MNLYIFLLLFAKQNYLALEKSDNIINIKKYSR